jgi:hypothetical protein
MTGKLALYIFIALAKMPECCGQVLVKEGFALVYDIHTFDKYSVALTR